MASSEVYEVVLTGGAPWGFRLQGGKEFRAPLRIAKVTPGSKAENAGVNEGDLLTSINHSKCDEWTHNDALSSIKKCGFELSLLLCRKQPSSPQPVRATPNTLSRSASHDDSTVSGKVVSRAVFKTSSSDSQQVPPYATLPRTVKVETEVRKKHYDDIDEDSRFDSYDGRRSNEWNPDIISDVVRPPKKIELFRSEETISPSYTSHQTESSPPSTHFKAPGDVRGFIDKPQPVGRGGRRVPDESAHESYGVNPQLTSDSVGSEEDFDNHLANGDTSSSDLGPRHSSRPPAIVHLRKQKEVAAVQATQEPPPVKTTTTVPLVRQERMPSTEQYIPSEPDHGPSRVKIKKGGKWYKEIFKEMHSTAGASSNLSALLASDAHKHVPRDESSSPTFEDNEVFTKPLAYQYEEPIKSSYSTTVSSERVPSQGDSPTERKPSSPRQGGEMPVGRKVPSWYKELQRGDEVPVDKIEHPESYVVQSHKKQASYDSTEELRQYTPREYSHVSQPGMVRTYTPPPSHALDIRRPPASTQIDHIGKERRPNPVTVQQEERNQPPSASSLYESRFRRTGPVTTIPKSEQKVSSPSSSHPLPFVVTVVQVKLGNIDRSRTGKEDRPSDEDVARRQRQEQARRHEEEARRREEEARRRKEEEERRRAEEEEMRRKQEEERKRKQMEEEKRRRKAEEEEARRKATQKPQFTAKALYSFQAQNPRELSFKKGDIMVVKRQIDKNWIEGEINRQTGIFPTNYVELRPVEDDEEEEIVAPMQATQVHVAPSPATSPVPVPTSVSTTAPSHAQVPGPVEGEARARYTFKAEGQRELPCSKGDILTLTRRIDKNWYEARLKGRSGIIPASYIEVFREPGTAQKGIPQQQQSRSTEPPAQEQAKEVVNSAYRPQEQAKEVINATYRPQEQAKEVVNSAYRPQEQAKEVISSAYRPQEQTKEVVNSAYRPQDQEKEVINVAYRPQEQAKEIVNSAYRQPEQLVARQDPRIQEPSRQEEEIISRKPTSTAYQENNNDYKQDFVDASPTSHTVGSPPRTTQVKYIEEVPDVSDPYPSQPIIEYDDRTVLPLQGERYKAVFSYDPMNEDELQLDEGDVVIVLEKCDDGWFVGTSTKTGMFGTFPGNYVVPCCKFVKSSRLNNGYANHKN